MAARRIVSGFLVISLSLCERARAHAYGPAPDLNSHMLCPRILLAMQLNLNNLLITRSM